jgi:hypothetical protein
MNYPAILFKDIYWTFLQPIFDNQTEFQEAFTTYHKSIGYKGKLPPIKWNEVCVNAPKVILQYVIFPSNDEEEITEPQVEIVADNNKNFTPKELLFKMHNFISIHLQNEDHHYFEGLTFATDKDPNFKDFPVYFVDLGS